MTAKNITNSHNQLVETQQALANAIRQGISAEHSYDPTRLAVYARLVRNNTLGFIDRCYVEVPKHLESSQWAESKETFIREGKAHSPYFQDIAGEFLTFCQQRELFTPTILELMDFEYTQLLAEVSQENVPSSFEWDEQTEMKLSGCAFLRSYESDFISSQFAELASQATQLIVWRNSEFGVYFQALNQLDFWLLTYLSEQSASLANILQELETLTANSAELKPLLQQTWMTWIAREAVIPSN
ncbi:HvfC family RiPP maturation protein [Ursidibacter arcticus]